MRLPIQILVFHFPTYGVPLRSKCPDIEMLFQNPQSSRDVQNMMPKIITYRSRPKKSKSSSSLFDETICNEIFDGKINSKSNIFETKSSAKKKLK